MYKLTKYTNIIRITDGASIPPDPDNRDYAEYCKWLAAGNVPQPADPTPNPRVEEIKSRLLQIDSESVRALRSKTLNRGQPTDEIKLTALDDEAAALRIELMGL